ncbi:MAG: hypothetical protein J0M08_10870 [Bacteroidetes bacterium]|nr:hypothetical protein [Bacteroidota bacterium]
MKNSTGLKTIAIALSGSVLLAGCNGLGKMVKNAPKVTYEVSPKPLEMHADSVKVTVSGKYPAKFFAKKATVVITPTLKYQGGEKTLKPITVLGEAAEGSGTKVSYANGGSFMYNDKIAYTPEMAKSELFVKATGSMKSKTKDFPEVKIADGVVATPLLVKSDEKAIAAKDKFTKTVPVTTTGSIYYTVNQSTVRPNEMSNTEMKAVKAFIAEGVAKGYTFKNANVSAYASPDGEQTLNADLAQDRAKSGMKAMMGVFGDKKNKVEAATAESFYSIVTTAEDWEGFKKLMEASSIADKDLILRVLTMYSDLDIREREIKNLAKTYEEVSNEILPKLRRAVITINGEQNSRTDDQIAKLSTTTPDSLSVEEVLYAANLTTDMNTKLSIYKAGERLYPNDWRCINNVGFIYLMQNKVGDAQAQFEKANKLVTANPIVLNNLGATARLKGDKKAAMDYYKSASGAGSEVEYNMGIINIMNGEYAAAVTNFGSTNSFNAALAQVLNGSANNALAIIDNSPEKDMAISYYLKAIVGARSNNNDLMINNLKSAINKDSSLKAKAKDDCEFLKYRANADFKAIVE